MASRCASTEWASAPSASKPRPTGRRTHSQGGDRMEFALTQEQAMIRDAAAEVLEQHSASAAVRRAVEQSSGCDDALWHLVARELGWCALSIPEAAGGSGLGAFETTLLLEAMGRRLACVPYFSTVCLAATLLSCCASPRAQALLGRIAAGELRA